MSKILVRYSKYSNLQSLELEMNEPIDTLSDARLRIFQRMIFKFNIDVDLKIARTPLILQMEQVIGINPENGQNYKIWWDQRQC